MDVTPQILEHHRIYGGSDNTNQAGVASSRALNYGKGATLQRAEKEKISTLPRVLKFKDTVGLFGTENHFVRVQMKIENPILGSYVETGWESVKFSEEPVEPSDPYTEANEGGSTNGAAYIDYDEDLEIKNTFRPAAIIPDSIDNLSAKYIRVELKNLKTGNIYIDCWLDVRLYNKYYDEHPYDVMYVKHNEPFYIGFHARNTKRLPYNIECVVGQSESENVYDSVVNINEIDSRLIATKP